MMDDTQIAAEEVGAVDQGLDTGETVTISLEEAAQIILQEQVMMDGTIHIPPGTYHILTQDSVHVSEDGQLVTDGDMPVEIMQSAAEGTGAFAVHTSEARDIANAIVSQVSDTELLHSEIKVVEELNGVDGKATQIMINQVAEGQEEAELEGFSKVDMDPNSCIDAASESPLETANIEEQHTQEVSTAEQLASQQERKPDLSRPIEVTEQTEVVINGRKCVLMMNQETGQMCAYPLLPAEGRRKRGRPRKQIKVEPEEAAPPLPPPPPPPPVEEIAREDEEKLMTSVSLSDDPQSLLSSIQIPVSAADPQADHTNAAEGLLELSATGPDGVRRSGRKRRKAKTLDDYEILEISSDDEGDDDGDEEVTPAGLKRKRSTTKETNPFASLLLGGTVKRGRGRPRRYPPSGQSNTLPTQIPAVIIPTSNGQTLMMAPIQGLQNLQAFQQQFKQLPALLQKSSDGSQQIVTVTTSSDSANNLESVTLAAQDSSSEQLADSESLDTMQLSKDQVIADGDDLDNISGKDEDDENSVSESQIPGSGGQPTIIQIPENLLPMFLPKKDPIKIGLKATESDLERLRCTKCDFQAYYHQQFQEHLSSSHSDHIEKCKCCTYLSLEKDDMFRHFKENHPRCVCHVCGFTSEHAYVIKRHMMRHNADGCTCQMCGKTYKDQYILKMHVKMVHMPAEVLYECTICAKKFNRKAHLKRHLRIHNPEKPYKCPHCEYRGCERSDISKHILIHDDPKHICEVCGKAFRHIKNKELHVKRHNGQRDYKCGVCDFFGYTFTDIRKHIERKHSDVKSTICDKCGQAFLNDTLLREHQKQQCEVTMIEQALTIATSSGTSEARIQIPSSLSVDGQHITIGDQISVDGGQVNITVEQVSLPDGEGITTEDQITTGEIAIVQTENMNTSEVEMTAEELTEEQEEVAMDVVKATAETNIIMAE